MTSQSRDRVRCIGLRTTVTHVLVAKRPIRDWHNIRHTPLTSRRPASFIQLDLHCIPTVNQMYTQTPYIGANT